jgi:hypothetical protein
MRVSKYDEKEKILFGHAIVHFLMLIKIMICNFAPNNRITIYNIFSWCVFIIHPNLLQILSSSGAFLKNHLHEYQSIMNNFRIKRQVDIINSKIELYLISNYSYIIEIICNKYQHLFVITIN